MIGEDFPAVLAAAQRGDEGAFTALWRDGNPALLRYLKVIAPESAEDVTAETWVTVVRGLGDMDTGRGRCGNPDTAGRTFLIALLAPPRPPTAR